MLSPSPLSHISILSPSLPHLFFKRGIGSHLFLLQYFKRHCFVEIIVFKSHNNHSPSLCKSINALILLNVRSRIHLTQPRL